MKITVVQSSRLGDIVQTFHALKVLKGMYSGSEISIFVWERFSDALCQLDIVDNIYFYDEKHLRAALKGQGTIIEKYNRVYRYLQEISAMPEQDLLINLSVSNEAGHIIASVLKSKKKIGPFYIKNRSRVVLDSHSAFFLSTGVARKYNRMNLVDIHNIYTEGFPFKQVFKPVIILDHGSEEKLKRLFDNYSIDNNKDAIGIVFSASDSRKAWNVHGYGTLADMLASKYNMNIFLIGTQAERKKGEAIKDISKNPGIYNFAGETDIKMIFNLIRKMKLIITNDTGPMHIAAVLGVPVINISLGCVYFRETGPYLSNSLIVTPAIECSPCPFDYRCPHMQCHRFISPEFIFQLSKRSITGEDTIAEDCREMKTVYVYRGTFSGSNMIDYVPVIPYDIELDEIISILLLETWKIVLKFTDKEIDEFKYIQKHYRVLFVPELLEKLLLVRINTANTKNGIYRMKTNLSPRAFIDHINRNAPDYLLPAVKYAEVLYRSRMAVPTDNIEVLNTEYKEFLLIYFSKFLEKVDKFIDSFKQIIGIDI